MFSMNPPGKDNTRSDSSESLRQPPKDDGRSSPGGLSPKSQGLSQKNEDLDASPARGTSEPPISPLSGELRRISVSSKSTVDSSLEKTTAEPTLSKARQARNPDQIIDGVNKYDSTIAERDQGKAYRQPDVTYVDDTFSDVGNFSHEKLIGLSKGKGGEIVDELAANETTPHFSNNFKNDRSEAVMRENYKGALPVNATDAFLSQYASACGDKSQKFPDSLPAKLPNTIVRDTVDGAAAAKAVLKAFNGEKLEGVFQEDGKARPFDKDSDATELIIGKNDPRFNDLMQTVNAKSTGHIVNDFNTLKGTNHYIDSIKLTRSGWATGIKMAINIAEKD